MLLLTYQNVSAPNQKDYQHKTRQSFFFHKEYYRVNYFTTKIGCAWSLHSVPGSFNFAFFRWRCGSLIPK